MYKYTNFHIFEQKYKKSSETFFAEKKHYKIFYLSTAASVSHIF